MRELAHTARIRRGDGPVWDFPRRPVALEELTVRASVRDDFGVHRAGISYAMAGQPPTDVVLGTDLPANGERLYAEARGVKHLFVNGRAVVTDDRFTGDLGGTLLRSGRDTETVPVPAGATSR